MNNSIECSADEVAELKDRPFNPWRRAKTQKSRVIVEEALRLVQNYETSKGTRKRKRRAVDQKTFEVTVEALLCGLMFHHVAGRCDRIYVSRSKKILGARSRYRSAVFGDTLPATLDILGSPEMVYVDQTLGHSGHFSPARRTTITAGNRLIRRIEEQNITMDDFYLLPQQEIIILKRSKEDHWDNGGTVEYQDTDQTVRFRKELQSINDWLARASIDFDPVAVDGEPLALDQGDRYLRRIFTQERFNSGGRLFGGFFQAMKKPHRINGLLIDGEEVIELDYGQMNPRIIYGMNNAQPDQDDLYAIPGYEGQRQGIKKVMNAMLFCTKPLSRMPVGVRKQFQEQQPVGTVSQAIIQAHPLIKDSFYSGVGHDAQFIESEIMMDVLLRLKTKGIIALPIHDAILVGHSHKKEAMEVMLSCFLTHTGVEGKVTTKGERLPLSSTEIAA